MQRVHIDGLHESLARLASTHAAPSERPPLEWQSVTTAERMFEPDDERSSLIFSCLPALTELHAAGCFHAHFLRSRFPSLTTLHLRFDSSMPLSDVIAPRLSSCTLLTDLHLSKVAFMSKHLCESLPCMPHLSRLSLELLESLESLSFLTQASPTLAKSLVELLIVVCPGIPATDEELSHLYALHSLQRLELNYSFDRALDETQQQLLTPPSALMMQLQSFSYDYSSV